VALNHQNASITVLKGALNPNFLNLTIKFFKQRWTQ